ncbi:MAG: hypothetical protein O6929_04550 [candidate division NC10 bacterium]|nr:hypothetical protein [candidate division NC10 bacterium]
MNEPTMGALERRMEAVERENRRWQWMVTVTLAVVAAMVILAQATPTKFGKVLEAERFVLRDTNGSIRAELGFIDGASVLLLNDKDGKPGVALSVLPDGPRRISLLDRDGRTRSVLTARADGDSGLRLFDKNMMHRASLDVMADGRPILRLADKQISPAQLTVLSRQVPVPWFRHPTAGSESEWEWRKTAGVDSLLPATSSRTTLN